MKVKTVKKRRLDYLSQMLRGFVFLLLFCGCQTINVIDYDKKDDKGKPMGIVAFSLYLEKDGSAYNYRCPGCFSFSMSSKNKNEKTDEKFTPVLYRTTEVDGATANHQNIWGNADSPFVALLLPENKQNDVHLSTFVVQFPDSGRMENYVVYLDPAQSKSILNLTPEPGAIKYLGLFRVKINNLNNPFEKGSSTIEKDTSNYFGTLGSIMTRGYFDTLDNNQGNEIRFYKEFLKSHKTGYWHDVANKKLNELLPKVK